MIPKTIIERLIDNDVYVYVKDIVKDFAGRLVSITEDDIIVLEDKYNNLIYIPISEITIITERR